LILDRAIARLLPVVPRPVVRRISSRYIAGAALADATATVRTLNAHGKMATIDVLGEETTSPLEAEGFASAYEEVLAEIDRRHLDANVSVKPTAFGLGIAPELCEANFRRILHRARMRGNFVRIDMEDATTTDATLDLYRALREAGYDNVGVVLQASLKRTLRDIEALADLRPSVRICKGIYVESPEIQYRNFDAVRYSFMAALEALIDAGCYPAVATHDKWLVDEATRLIRTSGLTRDRYEFQMLLGVTPELADALVAGRHRVRIYVPFGSHWYEYSIRRLQENPRVAGYIASDTVGRMLHRRNGN
jgi:proline dehydrogenase